MKQKRSFEDAYSLILEEILNGSLRPGEVVTEVFLAEKYGISRTPVREALNRFRCQGLISTSNRTKRIYSLSSKDLEEIFELKELIEGHVAKKAAERLTEIQAEELSLIINEMKKLSDAGAASESDEKGLVEKWLDLDRQFHGLLFNASGNLRAQQFIQNLNLQWHRLKVGLAAIEGRISLAILEHEGIGKAILARDPEKAGTLMVDHLENLKRIILKLMNAFNYSV